jgi:Zn-dependent protease
VTVARVPWEALKPDAFADHADDVALIYADKFASEAIKEAAWMAAVMARHGNPPEKMIEAVIVRALRLAALDIENALDDGSA